MFACVEKKIMKRERERGQGSSIMRIKTIFDEVKSNERKDKRHIKEKVGSDDCDDS